LFSALGLSAQVQRSTPSSLLGRRCSSLRSVHNIRNPIQQLRASRSTCGTEPQVSGRQVQYIIRARTESVSIDANDQGYRQRKSNQASGQSEESLRKQTSPTTGITLTRFSNGGSSLGKPGWTLRTNNKCHTTAMKCRTTIGMLQGRTVRLELLVVGSIENFVHAQSLRGLPS
jgi:hypothetical protein